MTAKKKQVVTPETIAFYRGSWSGKGSKVVKRMGGNFWGPSRTRCTIILEDEMKWMLEQGVAVRVAGGVMFPVPAAEGAKA
jgi:hypothetical protein